MVSLNAAMNAHDSLATVAVHATDASLSGIIYEVPNVSLSAKIWHAQNSNNRKNNGPFHVKR